jgi:heme/copper-type cytochrome/quinol oxidase subunit 2
MRRKQKNRGMVFLSDANAEVNPIKIEGKVDDTCSPTELQLTVNKKVTLILSGSKKMFMFRIPDLKVELMAMPGQSARLGFTPEKKGEFEFSCGVHNGPKVTMGKIIVK